MVAGILAHVDAGKTTLTEALLYKTGQIRNLGRVDHQDAYLDNDSQERERGITIFSKQARIKTDELNLTILDTPGHVDFSAEMERTLSVIDYAILVISGSAGVQGHSRTLWRLLRHYQVPVFIFVNKMDMDGCDRDRILCELKSELSDACVDFNVEEEDLYEEVAVCNEDMLEQFMETGRVSLEDIQSAVKSRELFPCFFGSALKLEGIDEFINGFIKYSRENVYPDDFSARVYKIGRDDRGSRLTYMKITGGNISVKDKISYKPAAVQDGAEEILEKIDQIRLYSGEKFDTCDLAEAGEIVAVAGLSQTYPGQGLGAEELASLPVLEPVLNYQMILPSEVNPAEFLKNMRILEEEDPTLYVVWKEELREIHVQLMGQVQMEVLTRLIKDRFGVVVTFGPGSIIYKETVAKPVEGVGHFEPLRHYAEVHLLIEPADTGSGITVSSVCSEDILAKNWQRLIATHIGEREHKGVLTGSALTDVKITILSGRAHIKHTEGGDFRQATYRAIRNGLKRGENILLEPYYDFTLEIPMEHVGRALTDLEQRFAKMEAPEFYTTGSRDMARIRGKAPVSTTQDYVSQVVAYTQGLGSLSLLLSGYDECHNPEEVIEKIGYDSETDFKNSTGSVFCAHGSGFVVPWNEVENYMHLPYVFDGNTDEESLKANARAFSADQAELLAGSSRRESWSKGISNMTSVELDAELADVYAREFGMSKSDVEDEQNKKWARKKDNYTEGLSGKPRTVKHDKKGNPIYPSKGPTEEYLIVDGYNIIFAWDELKELSRLNIDSARDKLVDILCNYQGYKGGNLLVVFDAYKVKGNPGRHEFYDGMGKRIRLENGKKKPDKGIEIVYTKTDETADAYIEHKVYEIRDKYRITVATNDGLEQLTVLSQGALRMTARNLKEEIERAGRMDG